MKAFLLLVFLFFLVFLFASSSLASVDLTNSGTTAASTSSTTSSVQGEQVIAVQDNNPTTSSVPVTGGCSDPYIVQDGDTLSQIATNCSTTLATIRLINPGISNANLIYAGQQIRVSNRNNTTTTVQQPTPVPVTGSSNGIQNQSQVVVTSPTFLAPDMLRAGTPLQVRAVYFPPNTPVSIAIGPKATGYNVVAAAMTDPTGTMVSNITVPAAPDATTPYVVVVVTAGQPVVQAMSKSFFIAPAQ